MSEYLKPQSPIKYKKDDAYIYPLTTADQVIMDDGSRLSGKLASEYATKTWVDTKLEEMGNGMPEVSGADDGKFLRVVNGTWAAVAIPNAEGVGF